MVDTAEPQSAPYSIVAKAQIERCVSSLAIEMAKGGESPREIERALSKLLRSDAGLPFICDILDTAAHYVEGMSNPASWLDRISSYVQKQEGTPVKRSLRASQLFEEARSAQGTERETVLIHQLEG